VNLRVSGRRMGRFQSSRLALACVGALFLAAISGASSRAGSSSSSTTFAFTSNASGWIGAPTSGSWVAVWDGTTGNPAGALKASVSGSGKTGTAISWTWSGSWTSLGVPAGTAVTAVTLIGLDSRVTSYVGGTASSFGTMQLLNGTGVPQGTLWTGRSFSAADGGWVAAGSQPTLSVPAALRSPTSSVSIKQTITLATTSGGSGKAITAYLDNLAIRVDYATAPTAPSVTGTGAGVYQASPNGTVYFRPSAASTLTLTSTGSDTNPISSSSFGLLAPASSSQTFAFVSNASGWVGAPASGSWVASWDGTTGNPAGALKSTVSGSGKSGTAITWTWSGSWTGLGVPAGATVLNATLSGLDTRVTAYTGGTASSFGQLQLQDGAGTSQGALWAGRNFSAVDAAWVAAGSQTALAVPAGIGDASSSIRLQQVITLATTGGGSGKIVTAYLDNLVLRIDYSAATGWSPVTGASVSGNPASRAYTFGPTAVSTSVAVTTTNSYGLTSVATPVTIAADAAPPASAISAPAAGGPFFSTSTNYIVTFDATDSGAGFGSAGWILQRQIAAASAGTCGSFADDTAAGNRVAGTTSAPGQTSSQTLVSGSCYRWVLTASDAVGNAAAAATSGSILVDTTAPAAPSVSNNASGTSYAISSGAPTVYFRPSGASSFILTASATDAQSGVASYTFGALSAPSGWTVSGSGASRTYTYSAGAGSTTVAISATNGAGTASASTTITLVADSAGPDLAVSQPPAGGPAFTSSASYTVGFDASDASAGFGGNGWTLQRQIAPASSGMCSTFVDDTTSGSQITGSSGGTGQTRGQTLTSGSCYRWVLTGTDAIGNAGAPATSGTLLVDTSAPTAPTVTNDATGSSFASSASAPTIYFRPAGASSFTLTASATDTESGVTSYTFGALSAASGWTVTGSGSSRTYTYASGAGSATVDISATNAAGVTGASTTVAFTVDALAPAVVFANPPTGVTTQSDTTISVQWTEADSGSGVATRSVQRQVATFDGSVCGSFADDGPPSAGTSPIEVTDLVAGDCYEWTISAADEVGNATPSQSGTVTVQSNAAISLAAPTAGQTLFSVEMLSANTAGTGISSVDFLVDDVVVGSSSVAPYTFDWDSAAVSDAPHSFKARAHLSDTTTIDSTTVTANVSNSLDTSNRLAADQAAGRITTDDYVVDGVYAAGAPGVLPPRYQTSGMSNPKPIETYLTHWNELSPAAQSKIEDFLSQPLRGSYYVGSLDPGPSNPISLDGIDPSENCVHHDDPDLVIAGVLISRGGEKDECVHVTAEGHFEIHYVLNGTGRYALDSVTTPPNTAGIPQKIADYAIGLEDAYEVYISDLGYVPPASAIPVDVHGGLLTAQVVPVFNCAVNIPAPIPTIQLQPDAGRPFYAAHHETFHVLQQHFLGCQDLALLDNPLFPAFVQNFRWLAESTAEWATGEVTRAGKEGDLTQYAAALPNFLSRPSEYLATFDNSPFDARQYGTWIFWEYLAERADGQGAARDPGIVKQVWELMESNPQMSVEAVDTVLQEDHATSLATLMPAFAKANYLFDYDDGFGDVETAWRAALAQNNVTAASPSDPAAAPHRPARVQVSTADPMSGTLNLGPGGSQYVELIPQADHVAGDFTINVGPVTSTVSAEVITVFYPKTENGGSDGSQFVCSDSLVTFDNSGNGTVSIPMNAFCTYAVLILTDTNPAGQFHSDTVAWSATFASLDLSTPHIKLGDGRTIAVLGGKGYFIPTGAEGTYESLCSIDLETWANRRCGPFIPTSFYEYSLSVAAADGRLYLLTGSTSSAPEDASHLYEIDPATLQATAVVGSFDGTNRYRTSHDDEALIAAGSDLFVGPILDSDPSSGLDVVLRFTRAGNGSYTVARYAASDYAGLGWAGPLKTASDGNNQVTVTTREIYEFDRGSGGEPAAVYDPSAYPSNRSAVYSSGDLWTLSSGGSGSALLKINPSSGAILETVALPNDGYDDVEAVNGVLYVLGDRHLIAVSASGMELGQLDFGDVYGLGSSNSRNLILWDSTTSKLYLEVGDPSIQRNADEGFASGNRLLEVDPSAVGVTGP